MQQGFSGKTDPGRGVRFDVAIQALNTNDRRRDATLRISGALHPGIFEQPGENHFFNILLVKMSIHFSLIPRFAGLTTDYRF